MDLDRYSDYHIEYIEADPIISRKGKAQAVKRLLREIARIDAEIEVIDDGGS